MIVVDVLLFGCIVIAYMLIAQAVASVPIYIIGFISGIIGTWKSVAKAKVVKAITALEVWFGIFFYAIYLFAHFKYQLWTNSQIYIWSNPILFLILYIRSVVGASATSSSNPLFRRLSSMVWFALIPTIIIVLIGVINNQIIELWSIKWGVAIGVGIVLLSSLIQAKTTPLKMERYVNLENRQKGIAEKMDALVHIVNVIGDLGEAKDLSNLSAELNKRNSKAANLLQQGKFSDAENLIIQSEIDVNLIEENLDYRIKYSLKDEIRSRLEQARLDIQRLRKDFEIALIATEQIDELDSKIQKDLSTINYLTFSTEKISKQLEPFESIIASIADIKTGLRLRRNVGSQLDIIHSEIDNSQLIIDIATNLGLETANSQIAKRETSNLLADIQKKELMSAEELINLYRSLRNNLTKFRESIAILKANIERNWTWRETESGQFISFVPKYCRTDKSTNGVLVLKKEQGVLQHISVSIDGTLLEFETDRNIVLSAKADSNYVITSFNFVGKRAGHGVVKLHSNELKEQNIIFPIRIIPTITELAGNSLLFGASFGGLILILIWQLGYEPKEYSSLAIAIGTALSLVLFVIRYIKISKYK